MIKLVALVPLFPLLGFIITGLFGKSLSKTVAGVVASGAILLSFIVSVLLFIDLNECWRQCNTHRKTCSIGFRQVSFLPIYPY
jgi:NADH:ubiquinone oxidoreductase subunit 5 (subunit L)/multisubunit Na+/H+ antiporter MnhA subunit